MLAWGRASRSSRSDQQSAAERLAEAQERLAAIDRLRDRLRRGREREEAEEHAIALRHPTPAEQWSARRVRVAHELGLHASQISDGHVDYLFERRGTAFMLGVRQALGRSR